MELRVRNDNFVVALIMLSIEVLGGALRSIDVLAKRLLLI